MKQSFLNRSSLDNFQLVIDDLPPAEFFVSEKTDLTSLQNKKNLFTLAIKSVTWPGTENEERLLDTATGPVTDFKKAISYSPMTVTFVVDEYFLIHQLMLTWLYMKNYPEKTGGLLPQTRKGDMFTDAHLVVLDNHKQPVFQYNIIDIHPNSVGSVEFDQSSSENVKLDCTFGYSWIVPDISDFDIKE